MKAFASFLFALAITSAVPQTSSAWFAPQIQFSIQPHVVTAQVVNHFHGTVYCQGYVYGQTQTGHYVNAWFSNYIGPMSYNYAYVYAYQPYHFVNAWADIRCQ